MLDVAILQAVKHQAGRRVTKSAHCHTGAQVNREGSGRITPEAIGVLDDSNPGVKLCATLARR